MVNEFMIRGKIYRISKEDVIKSLEEVKAELARKYYIEINGEKYPIKQVLSRVCSLPRAGFTAQDAYRILEKLGV